MTNDHMTSDYPYFYAWKNNPKRETLYQRPCRIVARGALNSIMIEFENGEREVVSRNAARKMPVARHERKLRR
jgi:hypothetical protein